MKTLKINLKSQLKNWNIFFLHFTVLIAVMIYLYLRDGYNLGFIAFFSVLLIDVLLTAYLHIAYYNKNKNQEFTIESDRIERKKNGVLELFPIENIEKVVICKSANMDKGGIPLATFESFRLARIYTKDNRFFIMTNLLEYDLEKPLSTLKGVKFERRKGFSFFI